MSLETRAEEPSRRAGAFRDPNLLIVFGVALIAILRADSVAPAFPGISRAFHRSSDYAAAGLPFLTCLLAPSLQHDAIRRFVHGAP